MVGADGGHIECVTVTSVVQKRNVLETELPRSYVYTQLILDSRYVLKETDYIFYQRNEENYVNLRLWQVINTSIMHVSVKCSQHIVFIFAKISDLAVCSTSVIQQ